MDRFVRQVNSQKWKGNRYNEDSFVMTIMDMDVPLFPTFRQAILNKLSLTNNFTYKDPSQQYYKSIIDWYRLRHLKDVRTQIKKQHIVISPSVQNIIYLMIQNETKENDGVLMLSPIFSYYKQLILQLKRTVVQSRLYNQRNGNISRYDINYSDLQQKAKKCKLMIFCNPHNPTGRIWTQKQVTKIVNICKQNNILLISDQIITDLVPQKLLTSFYSLVNVEYPHLVVANSISKSFNSSSIKGGYAFIKDIQLRKRYLQITNNLSLNANQFAISCTEIFYSREGLEWLKFVEKIIKQNYNYLISKTKNSLLVISQLQAGYAINIGFEGYVKFIERWYRNQMNKNIQQRNMVDHFLKEHKIAGNLIPYLSQPTDILTDVRFTIAVQSQYFKRFTDTLIASLFEVQYQYRQIDSKL